MRKGWRMGERFHANLKNDPGGYEKGRKLFVQLKQKQENESDLLIWKMQCQSDKLIFVIDN